MSFPLDINPQMQLWGSTLVLYLAFLRNLHMIFYAGYINSHSSYQKHNRVLFHIFGVFKNENVSVCSQLSSRQVFCLLKAIQCLLSLTLIPYHRIGRSKLWPSIPQSVFLLHKNMNMILSILTCHS